MSTDRERVLDIIEHLDLTERHRPASQGALEADEVLAAAMVRWIEVVGGLPLVWGVIDRDGPAMRQSLQSLAGEIDW